MFCSVLTNYTIRFLWVMRLAETRPFGKFFKLVRFRMNRKYGLNISGKNIGAGLYLGHAHNIDVNPSAVLGKNCNLSKGVTIGQENRGARKGAPSLGDCVWVGTNAVIVGKITIGDDVLIAPNTYVNCNVPSHSIVLGNPCRVISRANATACYIENKV